MAAQLPDWIIIDGEFKDLYSNPLEQFWARANKRRPNFYALEYCTRGYIATWEIINKQLFLTAIDGHYEKPSIFFGTKCDQFTLKTLFPEKESNLIKADWFTGKLRLPEGYMTTYEDVAYNSRFEKEMVLTVQNGNIIQSVNLEYSENRSLLHTELLMNYHFQNAVN